MNFNQTKSEWKVIGSVAIGYFMGNWYGMGGLGNPFIRVADTTVATPTGTLYAITGQIDWSFIAVPIAIVVVYIIWGLCQSLCQKKPN